MAGLDPSALHRIDSCKLPEELALTPFVKKIDAVGTPAILKSGICRAEYDMGPNLKNFIDFLESNQHDQLYVSLRNRKITNLMFISENGELPQNFDNLQWIGDALKMQKEFPVKAYYSPKELKSVGSVLLRQMFPDTRIVPEVNIELSEQKQDHLDTIVKKGTDDTGFARRAVPSLPTSSVKRTPSL